MEASRLSVGRETVKNVATAVSVNGRVDIVEMSMEVVILKGRPRWVTNW